MNLPWKKQQIEELKELPVLEATQQLNQILQLSRLSINFNISQVNPYYVYITYKEYPTRWSDHGAVQELELTAKSWPELIDKVIEHFK